MKLISNLLALCTIVSALAASPAITAQMGCPENFVSGQAPDSINQKLSAKTHEICYSSSFLKLWIGFELCPGIGVQLDPPLNVIWVGQLRRQ